MKRKNTKTNVQDLRPVAMKPAAGKIAGAEKVGGTGRHVKRWVEALKVKHWIKNFFVLAPFLASQRFGFNEFLLRALEGVIVFGIMASAVYLFNDCVDAKADREHPKKRLRPIASGDVSVPAAMAVSLGLAASAIYLAAILDWKFLVIILLYGANNILYSFLLKHKTVVDVMSIAFGFVLRAYAGGFLIGIEITKWLVACVFAVSLLFGFGKRRSEYEDLREDSVKVRNVHISYSIPKLNVLLGISASITIVTYMLYTIAPETKQIHGTDNIIFTTPFVVYGVYRYLLKVQEEKRGGPVEIILRDKAFILTGVMWTVSYVLITQYF